MIFPPQAIAVGEIVGDFSYVPMQMLHEEDSPHEQLARPDAY